MNYSSVIVRVFGIAVPTPFLCAGLAHCAHPVKGSVCDWGGVRFKEAFRISASLGGKRVNIQQ